LTEKKEPGGDQVHALLIEFADLGRLAKKLEDRSSSIAMIEHDRITERIRVIALKLVDMSERMDRHNEYLQLFAAAAILAAAKTDNPELEKHLMALSSKVSAGRPKEQRSHNVAPKHGRLAD